MKRKIMLYLSVVGIFVLIGIYLLTGNVNRNDNVDNKYDNFAKCLTNKSIVMYGTDWCPHCKKQKSMFGESFRYINYVNCDFNKEKCDAAGVKGYPTWVIDGKKYPGTRSLKELSSLSGCGLKERS